MIVKILPIDAFHEEGKYIKLEDFSKLFAILRTTPEKKQLRILQNADADIYVIKFAFGEDPSRMECLQDEIANLKTINANITTDHIFNLVWSGQHIEVGKIYPSVLMLTRFVKPYNLYHTFRQLALGPEKEWREALFQTLFTLAQLQQRFPGFRHNDLKADNILVTRGKSSSYCVRSDTFRRCWTTKTGVEIKIIDFELSTSLNTDIDSKSVRHAHDKILAIDYGLAKNRCDIFDIHLLAIDILRTRGELQSNFKQMLCDFIDAKYLDPTNLTSQFRLKIIDQEILQEPNVAAKMLLHPYFFHLRDTNYEGPEVTIS